MRTSFPRLLGILLACFTLVAVPASSFADHGDCGQPKSAGSNPTTADALICLKSAVGQATECDAKPCICDTNCSGTITTSDCLLTLEIAVGLPLVVECCCPDGLPCTSARIESRPGSDLDSGWTGIAHNADLIDGASITVRILRRCSDSNEPCVKDAECASNNCVPTCNCNDDTSCEFTGPTHQKNCFNSLADCTTNADCPVGQPCIHFFGPPLPLSSGGTPVCIASTFDSLLTGTADSATGAGVASVSLRSRVFFGTQVDKPCPTCGSVDDAPNVGDQFTCGAGPNVGKACTVNGVSPVFGGTSFDCPPATSDNVSGAGLAVRLNEITTATTAKTAQIPCGNPSFKANNPLTPGSTPKCIDHVLAGDPVCASNADCKRCTGDPATDCTGHPELCSGTKGTCSQAPDQPISCGYWCSCGFCNDNPSLPCFGTPDCPAGQMCKVGTGGQQQPNFAQQKPNDCSKDKNICGTTGEELCATTTKGECSEQSYRPCTPGSTVCEDNDAGTCIISPRPCFEPRITRSGSPSPLGTYCAYEVKTCSSNADCSGEGDYCVADSSRPESVALFCVPATAQTSINNVGGITGPGAIRFSGQVKVCRCGDSVIGCDETCDDGNTVGGDGCDEFCQQE